MNIGFVLMICAMVATALGAFMPVFQAIKISAPVSLAFLALNLLGILVSPTLSVFLLVIPAAVWISKLHWLGGAVRAVIGALAGAAVALALLYFVPIMEPGFIAGLGAAIVAVVIGKYSRIRLTAGFLAIPFMTIASVMLQKYMHFTIIMGTNIFSDAAATAMIISFVLTASLEYIKVRRHKKELMI